VGIVIFDGTNDVDGSNSFFTGSSTVFKVFLNYSPVHKQPVSHSAGVAEIYSLNEEETGVIRHHEGSIIMVDAWSSDASKPFNCRSGTSWVTCACGLTWMRCPRHEKASFVRHRQHITRLRSPFRQILSALSWVLLTTPSDCSFQHLSFSMWKLALCTILASPAAMAFVPPETRYRYEQSALAVAARC
jgi:hypothetical protein